MHVLWQFSLDTLQKFGYHHSQNCWSTHQASRAMLCPHMLGCTVYVSQFLAWFFWIPDGFAWSSIWLMVFASANCWGRMIQTDRLYIVEVMVALQVSLNCAFGTAHMPNPKQCWLIFRWTDFRCAELAKYGWGSSLKIQMSEISLLFNEHAIPQICGVAQFSLWPHSLQQI